MRKDYKLELKADEIRLISDLLAKNYLVGDELTKEIMRSISDKLEETGVL